MFLGCSYFSGDFSLDVLVKGVLIKKKGVSANGRMDGHTDKRTDKRMDGRTDRPSYRDARTHLKRKCGEERFEYDAV